MLFNPKKKTIRKSQLNLFVQKDTAYAVFDQQVPG